MELYKIFDLFKSVGFIGNLEGIFDNYLGIVLV